MVLDVSLLRDLAVYRPIDRPLLCTNDFRRPGFRFSENGGEKLFYGRWRGADASTTVKPIDPMKAEAAKEGIDLFPAGTPGE